MKPSRDKLCKGKIVFDVATLLSENFSIMCKDNEHGKWLSRQRRVPERFAALSSNVERVKGSGYDNGISGC